MKTMMKILTLLVVALVLLAAPAAVHAQDGGDGKVVMGGSYRLSSGQTLNGSLAVFGGEATIEDGALVNGDVVISGGTLTVNGEIDGDVAVIGGTVFLSATAHVHGDIQSLGGNVNRDPGATVDGTINSGPSDLNFNLPRRFPFSIFPGNMGDILTPIWQFMLSILQALVIASIAVVVAMLAPVPTQRVAASITSQPLVTGAIGLLTLFVAPILIVLLAITILLIPVSLIAVLALAIAGTFGWIAVGMEVGQRMGTGLFHTTWTAPIAAGIGTLVLSLISAVAWIIPCIGWLIPFVIAVLGLGGVLASKFGRQVYFRPVSTPTPPAPPAAPVRAYSSQPSAASAQVYDLPDNELPDVADPNDPQRPQNSL